MATKKYSLLAVALATSLPCLATAGQSISLYEAQKLAKTYAAMKLTNPACPGQTTLCEMFNPGITAADKAMATATATPKAGSPVVAAAAASTTPCHDHAVQAYSYAATAQWYEYTAYNATNGYAWACNSMGAWETSLIGQTQLAAKRTDEASCRNDMTYAVVDGYNALYTTFNNGYWNGTYGSLCVLQAQQAGQNYYGTSAWNYGYAAYTESMRATGQ